MIISSPFIKRVLSKSSIKDAGQFCIGLLFLCVLFFFAEHALNGINTKLPPALFAIACLFFFLLYYKCVPRAISLSAKPMLAHMSLFFIPAIVAIVNFAELLYTHALALTLAIVLCTLVSIALSAMLAAWLMPSQLIAAKSEKLSQNTAHTSTNKASK